MILAEQLVEVLREKHWTITTVESCTGGAISAALVDVEGASDVLRMAFVTYCDEAKTLLAGVREETLKQYTAVSRQTAREMAEGGKKRAEADMALSATGIAGPGGTEEFPAGLVYLGCAVGDQVTVKEFHFTGSRNEVRKKAVNEALQLALACIRQA